MRSGDYFENLFDRGGVPARTGLADCTHGDGERVLRHGRTRTRRPIYFPVLPEGDAKASWIYYGGIRRATRTDSGSSIDVTEIFTFLCSFAAPNDLGVHLALEP